jgi:hypothetical protein
MKTLNPELINSNLIEFLLSNEEMINIRGGIDGDPVTLPEQPPIKY